jgi:hypothetical protein
MYAPAVDIAQRNPPLCRLFVDIGYLLDLCASFADVEMTSIVRLVGRQQEPSGFVTSARYEL